MSEAELFILKQQASVLKELKQRYEGKTLDNVLQQLESRIAFYATGATTASRTKSPTSAFNTNRGGCTPSSRGILSLGKYLPFFI